jgi:hypothetical protein
MTVFVLCGQALTRSHRLMHRSRPKPSQVFLVLFMESLGYQVLNPQFEKLIELVAENLRDLDSRCDNISGWVSKQGGVMHLLDFGFNHFKPLYYAWAGVNRIVLREDGAFSHHRILVSIPLRHSPYSL